jgi:hypothetical protein
MHTFTNSIVAYPIPQYPDHSQTWAYDLPAVLIIQDMKVDNDVSSTFKCTHHRKFNSVYHQKLGDGDYVPRLIKYKNRVHVVSERGTSRTGDDTAFYMWASMPMYCYYLRALPNLPSGSNNLYIAIQYSVSAVPLKWVYQKSAGFCRKTYNMRVPYKRIGKELVKQEVDLSLCPRTHLKVIQMLCTLLPDSMKESEKIRADDIAGLFTPYIQTIANIMVEYAWNEYSTSQYSVYAFSEDLGIPVLTDASLFKEELRFDGYPVMDASNYWVEMAKQHSFLDACESVPRLSDNMLSNIFDLTSFIYNLVVKHRIDIPESLSDAWLAYRYQYGTTKADVEDAISFMNRQLPKDIWNTGYRARGQHKFTYNNVNVTTRCTTVMVQKDLDKIHQIWLTLTKYGMAPNVYVLWDMLPYSFVIDWFIPIGDILDVESKSRTFTENYKFSDIIYSLKYSVKDGYGFTHSVYYRWVEDSPPDVQGYYWFESDGVTNTTIIKRILDGIALMH